eukprot:4378753-Lingulodinium_polyedra.AAC.1
MRFDRAIAEVRSSALAASPASQGFRSQQAPPFPPLPPVDPASSTAAAASPQHGSPPQAILGESP